MGTKMAPPYANLFLGYLEETLILKSIHNLSMKLYSRFLDDIFIIWYGKPIEIQNFFTYLNQIHPSIKFTYTYSDSETNFLDTTIYINKKTQKLNTKLYIKPTDTRTFLHYNSYHPKHTKKSIIYSQAIRYRTIITKNGILRKQLQTLKTILRERGYPSNLINTELNKISNISQKELLYKGIPLPRKLTTVQNTSKKNTKKRWKKHRQKPNIPFIIPYSEYFKNLNKILTKHWYIIKSNNELRKIFPKKPFISYQRHSNLKDILIHSKFTE